MTLEPGTRLGDYEVRGPLGASGEGRYTASDTRLGRVVAVTVVPPAFMASGTLRELLERDIRMLASLQHPHICAPFEVGHQDPSTDFVVSEFVEGELLADRLARGPMDLRDALAVGIALADALHHAHRHGIAHRRLTPSCVMVTRDGGAKVMDFGLVPPPPDATSASSLIATRTSLSSLAAIPPAIARYMAPEQFDGIAGDARTDLFAVGAILYEMVAGKPAFDEKTHALLVAAVQTVDPEPVAKAQTTIPPALDHVLQRCLHKDPRQRTQTAWDLLVQLRWIAEGGSQIGVPAPVAISRRKGERWLWAAAAAGVLLAAGLASPALSYFGRAPDGRLVRFTVSGLPTGAGVPVSISPDGRWLIGSAGGAASRGVTALSLNATTTQTLLAQSNVTQAFWSPDGRSVGFFEEGRLKRAEIAGGPSQNICETLLPIGGGTWNRDGVILFAAGGVIHRVLAAGGQPVAVTALDKSQGETEHLGPSFLPDGRHYLYLSVSSESGIYLADLDTSQRTRLFAADSRPVYAAPGHILFNRGNALFAQPFDADALELSGEPIRIADSVATLVTGPNSSAALTRTANFTVSQGGVLAFKTAGATAGGTDEQRSLVWYDRAGVLVGGVSATGMYAGMDLSPDGRRFAVHRHEGTGGDLWSYDLAQGRMQRLTFDTTQENSSPVWSPDGQRIAFASNRNNRWGLFVKTADGTGAEELIIESPEPKAAMDWSPDGKLLLYWQAGQGGNVWMVPLEGDRKAVAVLQSQFVEVFPQVSPDGKWMAYQSNETGRVEVYVKQFPEGPAKWQVSTEGGAYPRWRADGKELYFVQAPDVMAAAITVTGSSLEAGVPRSLFTLGANPSVAAHGTAYHRFAVSADGTRFLFSQLAAGTATGGLADTIATLADGGGTTAGSAGNVSVILNWPTLLQSN